MRWLDWLLLLVIGLASSAWCLTAAVQLGPTFDEPFYLQGGLRFWREGKPGQLLHFGTMPLPAQVATLPLYLSERYTGQPWVWPRDADSMLFVARATSLVWWWLLLLYVLRLGQVLGGSWAGRLALLLVGLEPSFLAHAGLAGTDIALAACVLLLAYHFRAGRALGWRWRVGLPALLFGLGMLAKASTLAFGVLVLFAVEIERLANSGALRAAWQGSWRARVANVWKLGQQGRRDGVAIVGLGLLLALLGAWSDWEPSRSMLVTLAKVPEDAPLKSWAVAVAEAPLWPNGAYALWYQIKHGLVGHQTFLIGTESPKSLWFYFPVLLAIKLPVAVLVLLALALALPGRRLNLALGLAGLLLVYSLTIKVQLGVRIVLPLVAFLLVGLAVRLASLRLTALRGAILALLLGCLLVGDLRVWPDGLRYTNDLWGGPESGYLLASDSNYDWGQGLPELARWHDAHPGPLAVWYFGTDTRYPHLPRYAPCRDGLDSPKLNGYLAVGTTWLYGGYVSDDRDRSLLLRLRQLAPVARTRTFLIFREVTQ